MPAKKQPIPTVFISSTKEDLEPYRAAARDAALKAKCQPVMMDYFAADGHPTLETCLEKVQSCDVLVVIVAHRYGWIPKHKSNRSKKSITWLECQRALDDGKQVLAFLVDEKFSWPENRKENHRLTQAMNAGTATPELFAEVNFAVQQLQKFKQVLKKRTLAFFTDHHSLGQAVQHALSEWQKQWLTAAPLTLPDTPKQAADPQEYFHWLHEECATIDIRGLAVGSGKAHRFGIEELYIPLTTVDHHASSRYGKTKRDADERHEMEIRRSIPLHELLQQSRVVIIGDPGAGKTTFLRRIAYNLCQTLSGNEPTAVRDRLGLTNPLFPLFIRLGELAQHIRHYQLHSGDDQPALADDPHWLIHFLANRSGSLGWGLPRAFFDDLLSKGKALLLFDGLDEAPDQRTRELLSAMLDQAVGAFKTCRWVVTCRPKAWEGAAMLQRFEQYTIEPLEPQAVEFFLTRWSLALHDQMESRATFHKQELMEALTSRPDIRRMAGNPVMLTALAVVHWNERRLPEQRADLYESIIGWLLRSREQKPDRTNDERCKLHLQRLALAMQTHPDGRQVQVGRRWAAESIKDGFPVDDENERIRLAELFLMQEELDSGIIVGRGNNLQFWHLTFQEFMTARALGGMVERRQQRQLVQPAVLHSPEWREPLLLFTGVLHRQGVDKVDNFFRAILDMAEKKRGSLADEARCVGLIGAMLRDLAPFKYELTDPRYFDMLQRVLAIFSKPAANTLDLRDRVDAADALGQAGDPRFMEYHEFYRNKQHGFITDNRRFVCGHPMIKIPEGTFLMGAQAEDTSAPNYDTAAQSREAPVHDVHLSAYNISQFPVTVGEYLQFTGDDGYSSERYWQAGGFGQFKAPDNWDDQQPYPTRPVVGVSWFEAMAFASYKGMTLPTEAQWERAARGPGAYRKYPWGNHEPDEQTVNIWESMLHQISPVGLFPDDCTPEGVIDMGGNVLEWCRDWRDVESDQRSTFYERSAGSRDPVNADGDEFGVHGDKKYRVVRGGSFYGVRSFMRCAYRYRNQPHNRSFNLGFRVACGA
ncbi:SUMF1/EgtB/PvdO family nonheme iron enzyme [candidate division KSB1 bacterium]|nr:SUMF1/EgtB/PvdO family nonheme iron enzyme [candidate division KSB1 bacterium]